MGPVFPTPVGVFLCSFSTLLYVNSLPHARGGVSASLKSVANTTASSPRPWGCFWIPRCFCTQAWVFPTPVGVFLDVREEQESKKESSPRPWGCFSRGRVAYDMY